MHQIKGENHGMDVSRFTSEWGRMRALTASWLCDRRFLSGPLHIIRRLSLLCGFSFRATRNFLPSGLFLQGSLVGDCNTGSLTIWAGGEHRFELDCMRLLNLGCALAQPVSREGPQRSQEVAGGTALSRRATLLPAILYLSSKVPKSA